MSNYVQNHVSIKNSTIGVDYPERLSKIESPINEILHNIKKVTDDSISFETRNAPHLEIIKELSKQYPDTEIIHTFNDEGRPCIDEQVKIANGAIKGYRARYNDGEEIQSFPEWKPFPKTAKDREECLNECLNPPLSSPQLQR